MLQKILFALLNLLERTFPNHDFEPPNTGIRKHKFTKKQYFHTQDERKFYEKLKPHLKPNQDLFSNVRIEDIVFTNKHSRNYIKAMHVDFLLCEDNSPRLVIELDGESHNSETQAKYDRNKDYVFESAGLVLVRIPTPNDWPVEKIVQHIHESFNR